MPWQSPRVVKSTWRSKSEKKERNYLRIFAHNQTNSKEFQDVGICIGCEIACLERV